MTGGLSPCHLFLYTLGMTLAEYFEKLKTKEILCWGSGRYYRTHTRPFLERSGLAGNLKGTLQRKADLTGVGPDAVMLIAVSGYEEVLSQLRGDPDTARCKAVPSAYLEFLYEDLQLLHAEKPPLPYRKHEREMIPRILHGIWFSGEPMPALYRRCLESWKRFAPDFEIRLWDLQSYHPEGCLFFEQAIRERNWAFASDYARADILRRYGGVYLDLDAELLRPIDDLLHNDAFMSFESMDRVECGSGMGAGAGHPILREICESYENRPYYRADGTWDSSTCPVRYTQILEKHGLKKNGGFQMVEDITVYPFEVLTGKSFDTGIIYRTEYSYAVHHHFGSWVPDPAHRSVQERYEKIRRFLEEEGVTFSEEKP